MWTQTPRRSKGPLVPFVILLSLTAGWVAYWKLRARPGNGSSSSSPQSEAERERRRVAAFDPGYDPAHPKSIVEGVVKDGSSRPVDGAMVALTRNRGRDELPPFSRPIPRTATTTAGGRFRFDDVIPGDYGITAISPDGAPARRPMVEVSPGKAVQLTLTLGVGGVLFAGQIHDAGGGPVPGARAVLRAGGFVGPAMEAGGGWFQATADDQGVFRTRLTPGEYEITVRADGYGPARDRLVLSGAQSRRYRLSPAARLAGRVIDRQSGDPVGGASVWLRADRLDTHIDRDTVSDRDGRFSFDDLTPGGFVAVARAQYLVGLSRTVSVAIGEAATDVEIPVETGRAIRGLVVGADDKGVGGVRVFAGRTDPPFERPVFTRTAPDGSFALEGLLPARYRVGGWGENAGNLKGETALVTTRDVEGIRLRLSPATVVRGRVVDGKGSPVADAAITGFVEAAAASERRMMIDRTTSDAEGKFELRRLASGSLTVFARHAARGAARRGPEEIPRDPGPITLRLSPGASIAGTVTFEDGTPAPRVHVSQVIQAGGPMFRPPEQATTDDGGRFKLTGLEAGAHVLLARRNEMTGGASARSYQNVTLAAGEERTDVTLVVSAGGKRIAGRVVRPDGRGAPGVTVSAGLERDGFAFRLPMRDGTVASANYAVTDGDGNFVVEDLEVGLYTLWASDSAHADAEVKGIPAGRGGVAVRLAEGASVAGEVRTRDGAPVSDYTIAALPVSRPGASPDEKLRAQMVARLWSPSAQVHDPSGTFYIGRLAAGRHELTVTTADQRGATLLVSVAARERKQGLTIVVDAASRVVGRVVELEGGLPLEGVAVDGAMTTSRATTTSAKDGTFTLTGLPAGRARLDFRPADADTHVPEHVEVELKPSGGLVDVGLVKMMRGSLREKLGVGPRALGRAGFTVALVEGRPTVTGVVPGFPAARAGLAEGELVLAIDGRSTEGLGNGALDFTLAGPPDATVTVTVQPRDGRAAAREVKFARVPIDHDPARPAPRAARQ
jgi:protocatechuate 3,4-dioxygenase beta subunit